MSSKDYIPRNAILFCIWLEKALKYILANFERWGITKPDDGLAARLNHLQALTDKCSDKDHSSVDIFRRNDARKIIEQEIRGYLRGMVLYNSNVTDEDRRMMGLPIYDKIRTPIGDPVGQATADITYPGRTQLMLQIHHIGDTPFDERANYGFRIYYGVFPIGSPLPTIKELYDSRFTRKKRELFTFDPTDSGNMAVFCIRYENKKGTAGLCGPVFSAIIP